jgi:hypothetical protein
LSTNATPESKSAALSAAMNDVTKDLTIVAERLSNAEAITNALIFS